MADRSALDALRAAVATLFRVALSAALWFVVLAISAIGLLVTGAYVLSGLGVALVTAGVLCTLIAALVLIGMTRGQ